MAKIKKDIIKISKKKAIKEKKITPWLLNKIKAIRQVTKPMAARLSRWGGPIGVVLVILFFIGSLFSPSDAIQSLKMRLLNNPDDFSRHLELAEKLLANNQFEEAEKALLLAQEKLNFQSPISNSKDVLGQKTNSKLEELWQKKHNADPKDIQKLISYWEKIIEQKPNYRDAYLQLAILNYKIYENKKALEFLKEALEIDPNFPAAKDLEKLINQS